MKSSSGFAICVAVVIGHGAARAGECPRPDPVCYLESGKELLTSDPKRAAEDLLASYRLDERTDTLVLYATALQLDRRYALALETWKRVIVFRESELEAAKEAARTAAGRKLAAARTRMARVQKQSEQAADAIIKLWPKVGRVRVQFAGERLAVARDGEEVDASRDVLVNAGRDELVFIRKDGSAERVVVEVAAGGLAKIEAPPALVARSAPPPAKRAERVAVAPAQPAARLDQVSVAPAQPAKRAPMRSDASVRPVPPPSELPAKPRPAPEDAEDAEESEESEETPLDTAAIAELPRSRTLTRVGIGLAAGSVLVGGVAGAFGYLANRDYDRARDLGCTADDRCPLGPAADLAERSNDRARVAQVAAIGAGALLATGVTLWFVGRKKVRRPDVALHVGPMSTAISWRF